MNSANTRHLRTSPLNVNISEYWTYEPPTHHTLNRQTGELRCGLYEPDMNIVIEAGETLPQPERVVQFLISDTSEVTLRGLGDYATRAHGE